jgi:LacI family transcriptional regulator
MRRIPQVLLLIETSKMYGRGLLEGVGRYVAAHGPWSVYFEERALDDPLPLWFHQWRGDGVLVRGNSTAMARALRAKRIPVVETDPKITGFGFPFLYTDDGAVARLAVEHFLDRGFQNLAYCGVSRTRWSRLRRDAFLAELRRRRLMAKVFWLPANLRHQTWPRQRKALTDWLNGLSKPVGVLAENDICGMRLLDVCRHAGVSVPDQVAVLGVDNDPVICDLTNPPLTSVDLNVQRIGYEAAALLDRLMAGQKAPQRRETTIEPLGIVTRQSTDTLAVDDEDVADALRYMRQEACEGIDVRDVLRAVPISRRTLERTMRRLIGRTPKEEILRLRLERAKDLLKTSDLPIARISQKAGFRTVNYFANVFRRRLGLSPRQFRRQSRGS